VNISAIVVRVCHIRMHVAIIKDLYGAYWSIDNRFCTYSADTELYMCVCVYIYIYIYIYIYTSVSYCAAAFLNMTFSRFLFFQWMILPRNIHYALFNSHVFIARIFIAKSWLSQRREEINSATAAKRERDIRFILQDASLVVVASQLIDAPRVLCIL